MNTVMNRNDNNPPAPPRLLLWLAIGLFVVIVLAIIGGIIYYTGGQRLNTLFPYVIVIGALVPIVTIVGAIAFRKQLPRFFLLWVLIAFAVIGVLGAFGGVYGYRELLPPRYQEEMLTHVPFMRSFMRPTPAGGVIPTVASTSALSPEDLLGITIGSATETPALVEVTESITEEAALVATTEPTQSPTPEATATTEPATEIASTQAATEISAAPTALPVSTAETVVNVSTAPTYPSSAHLYNITSVRQDWNNCGPANITMALSFFGWQRDQDYAQSLIRPNTEDKNVSPHELVSFVNDQTFVKAISRIGGDLDLLKTLVAANFPVLIETGGPFAEGYDWIGHYQTVVGYDDNSRQVYLYDSYLGTGSSGEGLAESYDIFDDRWQDFNRVFIVLFEPSREADVAALLGTRANPESAAQFALETARTESRANPSDPIPWFNMGTSFLRLGMNIEAASAYDQAILNRLPFRMVWYQFGIFEAYFNEGRYDDVISVATSVIQDSGGNVEEAYYWQGRALAEQGDSQQASRAFTLALSVNPLFTDARAALDTLNA